MGIRSALILLSFSVLAVACAEGHCRRPVPPPADKTTTDLSEAPSKVTEPSNNGSIFVYKYDGSLQCKAGKAIAIETMAKELQGLSILSSTKKSDGLMHIQVCGSITGMANVYEIPAADLKKAEGRGFKKWTFE